MTSMVQLRKTKSHSREESPPAKTLVWFSLFFSYTVVRGEKSYMVENIYY